MILISSKQEADVVERGMISFTVIFNVPVQQSASALMTLGSVGLTLQTGAQESHYT